MCFLECSYVCMFFYTIFYGGFGVCVGGVSTGKYSPRAPSGAGQISKRSNTKFKNGGIRPENQNSNGYIYLYVLYGFGGFMVFLTRKYSPRAPSGAGQISKRSDNKFKHPRNRIKSIKNVRVPVSCCFPPNDSGMY